MPVGLFRPARQRLRFSQVHQLVASCTSHAAPNGDIRAAHPRPLLDLLRDFFHSKACSKNGTYSPSTTAPTASMFDGLITGKSISASKSKC
ncbi:hypothetical protein ABIB75_004223 [Bradyrhizobium sp. GM2.2]|uniref:hypothetical protein n=1 Tax=Bradyrhizobium sp. GM2.2 TaxID=3156358 RepID=UPI00339370F6